MLPVARVYIHIRETFSPDDYKAIGEKIYQYIDSLGDVFLPGLQKGIEITIEEGSTKTWIVIGTLINALIGYGGIRQSVDYLIKDGQYVSDKINGYLRDAWGLKPSDIIFQRRDTGLTRQVKSFFDKVDSGEISPEEATERVVALVKSHMEPDDQQQIGIFSKELKTEMIQAHQLSPSKERYKTPEASIAKKGVVATATKVKGGERTDLVEISAPTQISAPTKRIPREFSRPKRLVVTKRPGDRFPTFEYL